MDVGLGRNKVEPRAAFSGESSGIVTAHLEPAAAFGAIRSERGHDGNSLGGKGSLAEAHIANAIVPIYEEMEQGPVVPYIDVADVNEVGHVSCDPFDRVSEIAEPTLGDVERCR